jgi:superfamily II DNA/RNA helicase
MQALHSFRDNKATFLLATPSAARGLDLPAVSHVYNLEPPEDGVAYLHRAGRAGRIGSPVKGWGSAAACAASRRSGCLI